MKTKRTSLAPIAVASLLAGVRQARYNVKRDDSCGAQRSAASINKITVGANASSAQHQMQYYTIPAFYLSLPSSTATLKNRLVFYRYFCTQ
jgi:hypothetical protein